MKRLDAVAGELDLLEDLFRRMDEVYSDRARRYGFRCDGCSQTCCGERFYHHTLAESLLLERGLNALAEEARQRYVSRADGVVGAMVREQCGDDPIDVLCPLYTGEDCGLYAYRPLICRLHGIPYDYAPPGREALRGSGCHRFEDEIALQGIPYESFDRTPWFGEMAAIEIAIRRRLHYGERIRRTVADIVVAIRDAAGRDG